jgi:hypothetical protein
MKAGEIEEGLGYLLGLGHRRATAGLERRGRREDRLEGLDRFRLSAPESTAAN